MFMTKKEFLKYKYKLAYTPEDFGAVGDGVTDDTQAFINLFANCKNIEIPNKTYLVRGVFDANHDSHTLDGNFLVEGLLEPQANTSIVGKAGATIKVITNNKKSYNILTFRNDNIDISGVNFVGDRDTHTGRTGEYGFGISILEASGIRISNCTFRNFWGDGICTLARSATPAKSSMNVYIDGCTFENNRRQGLSICYGENYTINNCVFRNTKGALPESGVDVEPAGNTWYAKNITFNKCTFENNNSTGIICDGQYGTVSGIKIVDCISKKNKTGEYYFNQCSDIELLRCEAQPTDYWCAGMNNCKNITFRACNFDSKRIIKYGTNTNINVYAEEDYQEYIGLLPTFENWQSGDPTNVTVTKCSGQDIDVSVNSAYGTYYCQMMALEEGVYYKLSCTSASSGAVISFTDDTNYTNPVVIYFSEMTNNAITFKAPYSTSRVVWLDVDSELPKTLKITGLLLEKLEDYTPNGTEKTWNTSPDKVVNIGSDDGSTITVLDKPYQKIWFDSALSSLEFTLPAVPSNFKMLRVFVQPLGNMTITFADSKVKTLGSKSMVNGRVYEMLFTSYNVGYWICEIKEYN